jgi:hypothetical protein
MSTTSLHGRACWIATVVPVRGARWRRRLQLWAHGTPSLWPSSSGPRPGAMASGPSCRGVQRLARLWAGCGVRRAEGSQGRFAQCGVHVPRRVAERLPVDVNAAATTAVVVVCLCTWSVLWPVAGSVSRPGCRRSSCGLGILASKRASKLPANLRTSGRQRNSAGESTSGASCPRGVHTPGCCVLSW